jgi:hypothetical protein
MRFPKTPPARDEDYLDYIRSLPCCVCVTGTPVHPHHMESGGVGCKGSDHSCVPMCANHHREFHDMGADTFQYNKLINLWMIAFKCLEGWYRRQK